MKAFAILAPALALLATCGGTPDPTPAPDTCAAAEAQHYVGQPGTAIDVAALNRPVRIIPFDGMVTMDFSPARINFQLDQAGRVIRITCG